MRNVWLVASLSCFTLCSCQPDPTDAMGQLRAGSDKVCAAPGAVETLRGLILPKAAELQNGTATVEEKKAAIAAISVTFEATTMTSFDPAVPKAACRTTANITKQDGESEGYDQAYTISPSAQDRTTVVVLAETSNAKVAVLNLINLDLSNLVQHRVALAQQSESQRELAQLLAVVTPRWLTGRWITADSRRQSCSTGVYFDFLPGGILHGSNFSGSWRLDQDKLAITGEKEVGHFAFQWRITQADVNGFSSQGVEGTDSPEFNGSRCAASETRIPDEPASSEDSTTNPN